MSYLRKCSLLLIPLTLIGCDVADDNSQSKVQLTGEYGTKITMNVDALRDEGLTNKEIEKVAQKLIDSADSASIKNEVIANDKSLHIKFASTLSNYVKTDMYENEDMLQALFDLSGKDTNGLYTSGFVQQFLTFNSQEPTQEEKATFIKSYKKTVSDAGLSENKFMKEFLTIVDKLAVTTKEKVEQNYLQELENLSNTATEVNFSPYMTEGFYYSDFLSMKFEETNITRGVGALEFLLDMDVLKEEYNDVPLTQRKKIIEDVHTVIENERNFTYETKSFEETNKKRMAALENMVTIIEENNFEVPDTAKELEELGNEQEVLTELSEEIAKRISKLNKDLVNGS